MTFKLDRSLFALISVLAVAACRGDDNPGASDTDGSSGAGSSGSSNSTTNSSTPTSTDPGTSSTTGVVDPTTGPVDPTTGVDTCGFLNGCTTGELLPNGQQCASDAECASMQCYSNDVLMFGVCAECNEDQDCVDSGAGTACSLSPLAMTAVCTQGEPGSGCMSDAACMDGLFCDAVIDIPLPVLPDTCGECKDTADCDVGKICSPVLDMQTFSGQKKCIDPGTVQNNDLCPKGAEGDMACMSGHCTEAAFMVVIVIDICGECAEDADCDPGKTCMPAEASMSGLSGSTCV